MSIKYMIGQMIYEAKNATRLGAFFYINWKAVRNTFKEMPVKAVIAVIAFLLLATFYCGLYAITLPFALLNRFAESWTDW